MLSLNTVIAIDMGHTLSGSDYGTSAIKEESLLTREVGNRVIAKLKALGYKVVNCTCNKASSINDSLYYRYNTANNSGAGIFVSIHFNATPGGFGTEIYTMNAKELPEVKTILNNICSLGYRNRGVKDGSKLAVIRHTNMPAMLVECCFVDSNEDMARYNAEDIANAIVKGLTGQNTNVLKEENEKVKNIVVYSNEVDKRAAEYLADYLQCPIISNSTPFDYSVVENVYAVGSGEFTSYTKKIIKGTDRYETIKAVLQFIGK
ncbi:N-acetylmuramoyl-L-alanine amidase [Clostridium sp. CX1]|uniref:N-acetylmuramoyl-L-alanine amidase n=1 Tax=Clostridium sp. CX1 TaxID=2978346 RepID=UPI0021C1AE88|nr:N-acetylmuramoyl-L-alanine amidase [Clostridium sp. CX1]MCT8975479.1 N-acetylmuramoyl-L-alanine amidase [Clostridium sp. CX1]